MNQEQINKITSGMSVNQIKDLIISLMEQIFPVLDEPAKRDLILKIVGKSDDEGTSSMVHL